jgi:hypothetical protein
MLLWRNSELIGRVSIFVDPSTPPSQINQICQAEVERQEREFQEKRSLADDLSPVISSPELFKEAGEEVIQILAEYELTPSEAQKVLTRVFQSITFGQLPESHVTKQ